MPAKVVKIPEAVDPKRASVFDGPLQRAIRGAGKLLGADSVEGQAFALMNPMEVGPVGGAVGALGKAGGELFSRLQQAVGKLQGKAIHPNKLTQIVTQQAHPEEAQFTGLLDWIKGFGEKPIPTAEAKQFVADNPLKVTEKVLGKLPNTNPKPSPEEMARYAELGGLRAANRGALRDGQPPTWNLQLQDEWNALNEKLVKSQEQLGTPTQYQQYKLPGGANYQERLFQVERPVGEKPYISNHFGGEPNIIGWSRTTDRQAPSGKGVKFIEEIQSDLHQAGREKGYQMPAAEALALENQLSDGTGEAFRLRQAGAWDGDSQLDAVTARNRGIEQTLDKNDKALPNLPFKDGRYSELALKRALLDAAKEGKDRVAWTTGQTQIERYPGLETVVKEVEYDSTRNRLIVLQTNGETVVKGGVTPDQLPAFVGQANAQALLESPVENAVGPGWFKLDNVNFRTGGDGMREFYDKQLVSRANKLMKPFGAQVTPGEVALQNSAPFDVATVRNPDVWGVGTPEFEFASPTGAVNARLNLQQLQENPSIPDAIKQWLLDQHSAGGVPYAAQPLPNPFSLQPPPSGPRVPEWGVDLTPDIRQRLLKEGLPLLLGLLSMQPAFKPVPSHTPQPPQQ